MSYLPDNTLRHLARHGYDAVPYDRAKAPWVPEDVSLWVCRVRPDGNPHMWFRDCVITEQTGFPFERIEP